MYFSHFVLGILYYTFFAATLNMNWQHFIKSVWGRVGKSWHLTTNLSTTGISSCPYTNSISDRNLIFDFNLEVKKKNHRVITTKTCHLFYSGLNWNWKLSHVHRNGDYEIYGNLSNIVYHMMWLDYHWKLHDVHV